MPLRTRLGYLTLLLSSLLISGCAPTSLAALKADPDSGHLDFEVPIPIDAANRILHKQMIRCHERMVLGSSSRVLEEKDESTHTMSYTVIGLSAYDPVYLMMVEAQPASDTSSQITITFFGPDPYWAWKAHAIQPWLLGTAEYCEQNPAGQSAAN